MQKTIKARMFTDWEYGKNCFVIIDFNYDYAIIEEEVTFDGIKCYEYNSVCLAMKPIKEKYNELSYFKYEDGIFMFFGSSGKDISSSIPKDMINTISFSKPSTSASFTFLTSICGGTPCKNILPTFIKFL